MANNIIIQFSEAEFKELIQQSVREETLEIKEFIRNSSQDKLLSIQEAAAYLNLAQQTLYGFTSTGKIPYTKKGKRLYFKRSELDNWLQSGEVTISPSKVEILKNFKESNYVARSQRKSRK